MTTDSIFIFNF